MLGSVHVLWIQDIQIGSGEGWLSGSMRLIRGFAAQKLGPLDLFAGALVNGVSSSFVFIEHSIEQMVVLESVVSGDVLEYFQLLESLTQFDGILATGSSATFDQIVDGFPANEDLFVGLAAELAVFQGDIFFEILGKPFEIVLEEFGTAGGDCGHFVRHAGIC